jgi:hypothetical protein
LFTIYLQDDGTCLLHVDGGEAILRFDEVKEAINAARELSGTGKSPLTIYSAMGSVISDSLV